MRIFRWKAAIPLGLFLTLVGVGWIFFVDTAVERGIEAIGTAIVGAKVELEEADVQFRNGSVVLRGLQVTDPDAPMTNLVEVAEMVAQVFHARFTLKRAVRNVVFMGMGEPFDNFDEVMRAVAVLSDSGGMSVGPS